jgi:1-acyl-sn-glycerol-3-phosphate acyltransferase
MVSIAYDDEPAVPSRSLPSTVSSSARIVVVVAWLTARWLVALARGRADVELADRSLRVFTRYVFRLARCTLVVEGREHFDALNGRSAIVMSNHTSAGDIPALLGAVPGSLRMVMKQSLASFPLWSTAIRAAGFVPIDRANHEHALKQLARAQRIVAEKRVHLWIAPEGTRSTGALLPFKKGGFHLAHDLHAPIVPTFIAGAVDLMSRPGASVHVRFGKPIESDGKDVDALLEETRAAIESLRR